MSRIAEMSSSVSDVCTRYFGISNGKRRLSRTYLVHEFPSCSFWDPWSSQRWQKPRP